MSNVYFKPNVQGSIIVHTSTKKHYINDSCPVRTKVVKLVYVYIYIRLKIKMLSY